MTTANASSAIQPYLFFSGRCEEAIEFYRLALGAEPGMLMRFKDSPEPPQPGCNLPPGWDSKIMHGEIRIGSSTILLSDGQSDGKPTFQGFALSLLVKSVEESQRAFQALAQGGQVQMPLTKTFFSPSFGMVADRFGICWMIYVAPSAP